MTVVTVTHDSRDAIEGFLAALPEAVALVVVDNASRDGTPDAVAATRPAARVIRNAGNRGFGAGCNAGLDAATTEFALLLNPDARLAPGALDALVAAAERFPRAGILAPTIIGRDGRRVRSFDTTRRRRQALPRRRDAEPWPQGPTCFDFVSGAAMLLRPGGGLRFDESLFLFYEDDAICAEARARGQDVVLVPDALVEHAGGTSSPPSLRIRWRKAFHMALSRQVFAARHGHADAGQRLLRHGGKAIGHALTLRGTKLVEDLAGLAGTLIWLTRRRANHTAP